MAEENNSNGKNGSVKRIGENISEIKRVVKEIDSLLKELKRRKNPEERKIIFSSIGNLREKLRNMSQDTIDSVEKVPLARPLNESLKSMAKPGVKPLAKPPIKPLPKTALKPGAVISSKPIKRIKPTFLEKISLKKMKMGKIKIQKKKEKKPSKYVNIANKLFYNLANSLINKGKFRKLGRTLVKSNMEYISATYVPVIFFSTLVSVIVAILVMVFLLFFNVSSAPPFITSIEESLGIRFLKVFWILFAVPVATYAFAYFYPELEKKSLESKINQELPFATIHMSSITSSMIEPSKIFSILISTGGYPHLEKEFIKLQNEINIYGYDLITALRNRSANSPSRKLADLYNGLVTTITSGGDLPQFFEKRSQTLLFEHRLEVEKSAKTAETFMDIYISAVIAAPMILMLLLMMMSISGFGISLSPFMISLIMILSVSIINIVFLTFLHLKQPKE
ncbi:MAG: type II secretion system F family protein [Nanoarchaeota archaeon]